MTAMRTSLLLAVIFIGAPHLVLAEPSLHERLTAADETQRQAALADLPKLDLKQKRQVLLNLIADLKTDPAVTQRAADALGVLGGYADAAVPALVEALHSDEDSVYQTVSKTLLKIGPVAVPTLERATNDSNFIVRRRVAEILGRYGPSAARAAPALVRLLQDPQFDVHSAAESALISIGDPAVNAVGASMHDADEQTRRSLVVLLGKLGNQSAAPLIRALRKDENPFVRGSAAEALGQLKGAANISVPALTEAFGDLDEGVRGSVADALGALGDASRPSIGILIAASHADKEPLVQQKSRDALAKIGGASSASLASLIRLLHSEDSGIRADVIKSIGNGNLTSREAEPLLTAGSKDADAVVRLQVLSSAETLGHRDAGGMLPIVQSLSKDPDPTVRKKAEELLLHHLESSTH